MENVRNHSCHDVDNRDIGDNPDENNRARQQDISCVGNIYSCNVFIILLFTGVIIMTAEEYINEAKSVHGAAAEIARTVTGMVFPEFSSEPMTVKDASDLTGLTQTAIRAGILNGWLPIGVAVRDGKQVSGNSEGKANFIIFPRKVWEVTGHIWRGKHESEND